MVFINLKTFGKSKIEIFKYMLLPSEAHEHPELQCVTTLSYQDRTLVGTVRHGGSVDFVVWVENA